MRVIRKKLDPQEGLPPNVRWSDDCECIESTFDGGETWVETPEADPRNNPGGLAPAIDDRCAAAIGMRNHLEFILDQIYLATSLIDMANAILAIITVTVPGFGLLVRLIILLCEALLAIGTAALVIEFDEDAYDQLQCIFYDEIGEDGRMTQAQLETINTRICDEMSATVCLAMGAFLNTFGSVGWSNFGALYGEAGDCSDCEWCIKILFNTGDGTFYLTPARPEGSYVAGNYWRSVDYQSGSLLDISIEAIADCTITAVIMKHGLNGTVPNWNGSITANAVEILAWAIPGYFALATESNTGSWDLTTGQELRLAVGNGGGVGNPSFQWGAIFEIELHGIGDIPFAWDEC